MHIKKSWSLLEMPFIVLSSLVPKAEDITPVYTRMLIRTPWLKVKKTHTNMSYEIKHNSNNKKRDTTKSYTLRKSKLVVSKSVIIGVHLLVSGQ